MFFKSNCEEERVRPRSPKSPNFNHGRFPLRFLATPESPKKDLTSVELPLQILLKRTSNEVNFCSPVLEGQKNETCSVSLDRVKAPLFSFDRLKAEEPAFSISLKKCQQDEYSVQSFDSSCSEAFKPAIQTELKHFRRLFFTSLKVFCGEPLEPENLTLDPTETVIFNCLLNRKFLRRSKFSEEDFHATPRIDMIAKVTSSKSLKRPEECYKFIHTRVLKHLKRKFRAHFNIKSDLDKLFYRFYFQKVADSAKVPLEKFAYPLASNSSGGELSQQSPQKKMALNAEYFRLLFKSSRFKKGFEEYTSHALVSECRADIIQKLEKIFLKWEKQLQKNSGKDSLEEIKDYLLHNKHCKLPWTLQEIDSSIRKLNCISGGREENLSSPIAHLRA